MQKLKFSHPETEHLVHLILEKVHLEKIKKSDIALPKEFSLRDPTDRHVVELAVSVDADLILSWDKDLTELHKVGKIRILTPRGFWLSLPRSE